MILKGVNSWTLRAIKNMAFTLNCKNMALTLNCKNMAFTLNCKNMAFTLNCKNMAFTLNCNDDNIFSFIYKTFKTINKNFTDS